MNYYSIKSHEQKGNCNLILKNIPLTAKEEDLEKIFKKFGNITSIRIEKNKIEQKEEKNKKVFFNIENFCDEDEEDDTIYYNINSNKNDVSNLFNCYLKEILTQKIKEMD